LGRNFNQFAFGRITRFFVLTRVAAATLVAYARIAHVVVGERLWMIPPRPRRAMASSMTSTTMWRKEGLE
jgi:hypothetical protein